MSPIGRFSGRSPAEVERGPTQQVSGVSAASCLSEDLELKRWVE